MEEPKNFIEQYSITYPDMFAEYMGLTKEQLVGLLINLRLQIEHEMEDNKGCDNCSNCIRMQQLSENLDEIRYTMRCLKTNINIPKGNPFYFNCNLFEPRKGFKCISYLQNKK